MVQSGELHICAPVYLCWCRANTRHTPHYAKLHGQTCANTIHHHGADWGTLVLYTHHIRPQHLTWQCSWGGFWHFKKTLMQLKAGWPTSSHWGELLERSTVPHTVVFQVWAKRLLLFPGASLQLWRLTTHTTFHSLSYITVWSARVIKFPSGFPTETLANRGGTYLWKNHKGKDTIPLKKKKKKRSYLILLGSPSSQMELGVEKLQDSK